jgi:hypothetical protein
MRAYGNVPLSGQFRQGAGVIEVAMSLDNRARASALSELVIHPFADPARREGKTAIDQHPSPERSRHSEYVDKENAQSGNAGRNTFEGDLVIFGERQLIHKRFGHSPAAPSVASPYQHEDNLQVVSLTVRLLSFIPNIASAVTMDAKRGAVMLQHTLSAREPRHTQFVEFQLCPSALRLLLHGGTVHQFVKLLVSPGGGFLLI